MYVDFDDECEKNRKVSFDRTRFFRVAISLSMVLIPSLLYWTNRSTYTSVTSLYDPVSVTSYDLETRCGESTFVLSYKSSSHF
jgi:hypothetical protein